MGWFSRPGSEKSKLPAFLNVPWGVRDVIVMVLAWFGIQIAVMLLLHFVGQGVPSVEHFLAGATSGKDIGAVFGLDLLDAVSGFGVVAIYLRRYQVSWEAVGWRRVNVGRAVVYIVGVLVLFVIVSSVALWVSTFVPGFNADQAQDNEFIGAAGSHHSLALIALVLLPPVLEETIFRGFMFPAMAKKWGVAAGAVVSSAVFGLAHFQPNISVYTFVLGLLLCFMYVRLKSIVPGMVLHMLNNYLAFFALTHK
jgi:membrane protease YdiL (CAAX protease family)